jgi:hypothetical protein
MRLIDAEQIGLTDMEIIMCDGSSKKALEMLIDKIVNAPTIDAVQVVRCKDCKHRPKRLEEGKGEGFNLEFPDDNFKCPCHCDDGWYNWMPDDNWFCGDGERKES